MSSHNNNLSSVISTYNFVLLDSGKTPHKFLLECIWHFFAKFWLVYIIFSRILFPPSFWFGLWSLTYKRTDSLLHQVLIGNVVSSCLLKLLNLWSQGQRHLCHGEDFNTRHMSQEHHASRFHPKRRFVFCITYIVRCLQFKTIRTYKFY